MVCLIRQTAQVGINKNKLTSDQTHLTSFMPFLLYCITVRWKPAEQHTHTHTHTHSEDDGFTSYGNDGDEDCL